MACDLQLHRELLLDALFLSSARSSVHHGRVGSQSGPLSTLQCSGLSEALGANPFVLCDPCVLLTLSHSLKHRHQTSDASRAELCGGRNTVLGEIALERVWDCGAERWRRDRSFSVCLLCCLHGNLHHRIGAAVSSSDCCNSESRCLVH